jgi:hypothetical protein
MNQYKASTTPFRNHHVHDDDGEEDMEPINVDFNETPGLKTFSYDSIDMEYVAAVVGLGNNIYFTTDDIQSPQNNNKRRKITTSGDYDDTCQEAVSPITTRTTTATVITPVPEKESHVTNVEFDPIPEAQLESLIIDSYSGTDNKEDREGDTNDRSSTIITTALQSKPSVFVNSGFNMESFSQSDTRLDEHDNNNKVSSTTTNDEDSTTLTLHNVDLHDGEVYRVLKPLLPLDESLEAILLLLLHMELLSSTSTSTTINKSVVKFACDVVYGKLEPLTNNNNNEDIQQIQGNIVETLINEIGSTAVAIPFQASAQTSDDQDLNKKIHQIFFQQLEINNNNNGLLSVAQTTSATSISRSLSAETEIIEVGRSQLLEVVTATTSTEGASTRNLSHDDDYDNALPTTHENKNSKKFVPTLLQVAIAYGASYCPQTMTLEDFVNNSLEKLQSMDTIQLENLWNDMVSKKN